MRSSEKKPLAQRIKGSFRTRSWHAGSYSVFAALIVLAIAAAVNLAVGALPASATEIDLTPEKLYTVSGQTEQVLAALQKDAEIFWIVQDGQQDPTLQRILNQYAASERVTVTQVDPVKYPSFASKYTNETVSNNSLAVVCGERSMYVPYSDIWTWSDFESAYNYYYTYGSMPEYDSFAGEEKLTSALRYVTSDDLPQAYTLTGHGETGLDSAMTDAVALENVQMSELSLLTVEAVPEDCSLLMLCGPESDISEAELAMIEDYLAGGGQMLVTTAYTEKELPNLTKLLSDYGLELSEGLVIETDASHYNYGYADLLLPELASHEITAPLTEGGYSVLFPDAQALTVSGTLPEDVTVSKLLTTSSGAYLKTELSSAVSYEQADGDAQGPFVLGAAAQNAGSGARLVVFASTAFTQADYSNMVSGANKDLFLNAVDWLCQMQDAISIHAKTLSSETLSYTDGAATIVKLTLIIAVPLAFIAMGAGIFIRRRRR